MNPVSTPRILRELLILIISIVISAMVLYPVTQKIAYQFYFTNFFGIFLAIQYFRWIVFYNHNVLFKKNPWIRLVSIMIFFSISFYLFTKNQDLTNILENQEVKDIAEHTKKTIILTYQEQYDLFKYIRQITIFSGFTCFGLCVILLLRIAADFLGYQSDKMKRYLAKK